MDASKAAFRASSISVASVGMPKSLGESTSKDGEGRPCDSRYWSILDVFVETRATSSAILVTLMSGSFTTNERLRRRISPRREIHSDERLHQLAYVYI